ncbi:flagellar protein FliT [Enterobacteriaceae bacterium C23F]
MDKSLFDSLDVLLASSENLLNLAGEELWDAFNDGVDKYLPAKQRLAAVDFSQLDERTRSQVVQKIETIMANDAEIMQRIRVRLSVLSKEIADMRKSNTSAQAYRAV